MYKQVETDEFALLESNKARFTPLATLADKHGGRVQITEDDHCFVVLVKQADDTYRPTPWIFPEAAAVIKDLLVTKEKDLKEDVSVADKEKPNHFVLAMDHINLMRDEAFNHGLSMMCKFVESILPNFRIDSDDRGKLCAMLRQGKDSMRR